MKEIVTCLWFDGDAEEAATFYTSILPDSKINRVMRSPSDTPGQKAGEVLTVEFTLMGRPYMGLNGGPQYPFTEAVSFQVMCDDQEEVDRMWSSLSEGGSEVACGWLKDRPDHVLALHGRNLVLRGAYHGFSRQASHPVL